MKRIEKATQAIRQTTDPEALLEFNPHFYTWPETDQEAFNGLLTMAAQTDPPDPDACRKMLEIAHRHDTPAKLEVMRVLNILKDQ